tara:strand:+ start:4902 stop:5495 length:594 start_codon:yes stop_codon:yes gene_type:complete
MIKKVFTMFPQTLVVCGIDADHSKVIQDIESVLNERDGFYLSKTNLHTNKIFEDLSTKFIDAVQFCFDDFFQYKNITPKITSMWATGCEDQQNIHRHNHPNSFISGAYYPQDIDYAPIRFFNPTPKTIVPDIRSPNFYNVEDFIVRPQQGDLLLFPSYVQHETAKNLLNTMRYTISFNVFPYGTFGEDDTLSSLEIR